MSLGNHIKALHEAPEHFLDMASVDIYAIDWDEIQAIQLKHLSRRFAQLRPKVQVLDRLASDVRVDAIKSFDDIVPLGLPHTMYKSYAATDADNGRYDRL